MLVGDQVKVIEACKTDSEEETVLELASVGTVDKVETEDADGNIVENLSAEEIAMYANAPKINASPGS